MVAYSSCSDLIVTIGYMEENMQCWVMISKV